MIPKLTYTTADLNDLLELQKLGIISYSEYQEDLSEDNWRKLHYILHDNQSWKELITKSTVIVCKKDNVIVGAVYFFSNGNPTDLYQNRWSYFRSLSVHPQYRKQGIGQKLTLLCIEKAKKTGEQWIALHTSEFMNTARNMYEKMGFKKTKEVERLGKRYWVYLKKLN